MNDLIAGALDLTIFGMGFVFIFLTTLVFVTKGMSYLINKNSLRADDADNSSADNTLLSKDDIDEEAKFIIEQAIKLHTGA